MKGATKGGMKQVGMSMRPPKAPPKPKGGKGGKGGGKKC